MWANCGTWLWRLYLQSRSLNRTGSCHGCPKGRYSADGDAVCTLCPTGWWQKTIGMEECFECPEGRFQHTAGHYSCYNCPAGKFGGAKGAWRYMFGGSSITGSCMHTPSYAKLSALPAVDAAMTVRISRAQRPATPSTTSTLFDSAAHRPSSNHPTTSATEAEATSVCPAPSTSRSTV